MSTREAVVEAYYRLGGNIHAMSRELDKDRSTIRHHLKKAGLHKKALVAGDVKYTEPKKLKVKRKGRVIILTCAQSSTPIHEEFWKNLNAYAAHRGAEIHVSRVEYNHNSFQKGEDEEPWYDPVISNFISDKNLEIAPGLVWNGEVNISPTAVNPLSGFDTFNGEACGIFPHTKVAMASLATAKDLDARFNYTTGTITQRNYVPKKAGQKASFHHAYAALVVEVNAKGEWWVRQLSARENGTFQDLRCLVEDGKVTDSDVEGLVWGDIHTAQLDPVVQKACWTPGGMLDVLHPKYQVYHDLLDFRGRNHHDKGNCHLEFAKHLRGKDDVQAEIQEVEEFLVEAQREDIEGIVVPSNHDGAMTRWLREADYKSDPKNAIFFLRAQLAIYEAIEANVPHHVFEWAVASQSDREALERFLEIDESFVIKGIEVGQHGHLGSNGSRGSPKQFAKTGAKSITAHTHSASITDGNYCVGTASNLDCGYNVGASSWSHTHAIIYPSGKRALVTMRNGKWCR